MQILYSYYNYLSNYSNATKEEYYECVKLYLRYLKETKGRDDIIQICNVKQYDIYNYVAYMDALSKNTKNIRLNAIKNFYSFLDKNLSEVLFEDIKLYGSRIKTPYFLSSCELRTLCDYYKGKRNRLIIYLFVSTGIRLSELANIKVADINLKDKTIKIKCKGRQERIILINEKCKRMLKDYMSGEMLFNIKKRQIQNIVTDAIKGLGLKGSVHTLRHSSASMMYQYTKDILLTKEFLGHKSIISTQIYTHIHNDEVKRAVESNPLANFYAN